MKKALSLILSVVLIMSMIAVQPVFASDDGNLALGKPVTALTTRDGYKTEGAVDGDITTGWASLGGTFGTWYMVDLEESYVITSVILHNRLDDQTAHYRRNVNVEFSNTPDFAEKETVVAMTQTEAPFGEPVEIKPPSKKPYRYVRLVKLHTNTFVLNEIEVYGYLPGDGSLKVGQDVIGTYREGPVKLLSYLGLMGLKDEENELFDAETIITRAEAAEAVTDAFGGDISYGGTVPFNDIDVKHENYEDVKNAYGLGYITGYYDSSFRPNDYVTKTEFTYMLLRAIGYSEVISQWFDNNVSLVMQHAKRLDLFDNITVNDYNEPISRGDVAMAIYNALLAPQLSITGVLDGEIVYEEKDNILKTTHNILLIQGIVEENGITVLNGDSKSYDDSAKIGRRTFVDSENMLDNYLGREVVVAVSQKSPKNILLVWQTEGNKEVVLPANTHVSSKEDISSKRIIAHNGTDRDTYKLENDFYVVKNNISHPYYIADDLMLSNGQLRLLDNNNNGKYDVVFIEEYTLHYIKNAFYDETDLTLVDSNGLRKVLKREGMNLVNSQGESVVLRQLTSDSVVKIFATPDGEYSTVILYNKPVVDTLSAFSNDEVTVGEVTYPFSLAYKKTIHSYDPALGERVSVFVDEAGEALWMALDVSAYDSSWIIAFSQQVGFKTGLSQDIFFRVFTQNGTWSELKVSDKVVVDGKQMSLSELTNTIKQSENGRFVGELLRYKLNPNGEIIEIDTVSEAYANSDMISDFNLGEKIDIALYTPNSGAFWNYQQMIMPASNNTITFVIPKVGGEYTTDSKYDKFYRISTVAAVAGTNSHRSQNLQSYMQEESGYPSCFMTVQNYPAQSGGPTSTAITSETAPFMLVERVCEALNDDGEIALKVIGQTITNSGAAGEASFFADITMDMIESGMLYQEQPDCLDDKNMVSVVNLASLEGKEKYISNISDIGFGDIVRYQAVNNTAMAVERVFDFEQETVPQKGSNPDGDTWYITGGNNTDFYIGYYRYQFGFLKDVYKDSFSVDTLAGYKETYKKTSFGKFIYCDVNNRKTELALKSDISEYEGANVGVMLYSYNGSPRLAIIYPYK